MIARALLGLVLCACGAAAAERASLLRGSSALAANKYQYSQANKFGAGPHNATWAKPVNESLVTAIEGAPQVVDEATLDNSIKRINESGHLGQLPANHLVFSQRLPEGLALHCVLQ